jgi:hypothetical protein
MLEVLEHTIRDTLPLVPFLALAYFVMEFLEHRMSAGTTKLVKQAGKYGPLVGAVVGVLPQCGFAAASANLYAARIITRGTLIAVFLSTSDEMLHILLTQKAKPSLIAFVLLSKVIIGMIAGLLIDRVLYRKSQGDDLSIHDLCENDHCHCERGILQSALRHTLRISLYILLFTFALHLLLHYGGEEALNRLALTHPIVGSLVSGIIGLIPNCAGSVAITSLYLNGAMSLGSMMSGLLVGSGVGLLILLRMNHNRKDTLQLLVLLFGIGVTCGVLINFFQLFFST